MSSDYQTISTAFTHPDGSVFNGFLVVRVPGQTMLANGGLLTAEAITFTVTGGSALGPGVGGLAWLPITEDANPPLSLGLALVNARGQKMNLGEVVVPRPDDLDPHPTIPLTSILPSGTL
jgi:hypothetical protein